MGWLVFWRPSISTAIFNIDDKVCNWRDLTMRSTVTLVAASFVVLFFAGDCTAQLKSDAVKAKNNSSSKGKTIFLLFFHWFRGGEWWWRWCGPKVSTKVAPRMVVLASSCLVFFLNSFVSEWTGCVLFLLPPSQRRVCCPWGPPYTAEISARFIFFHGRGLIDRCRQLLIRWKVKNKKKEPFRYCQTTSHSSNHQWSWCYYFPFCFIFDLF